MAPNTKIFLEIGHEVMEAIKDSRERGITRGTTGMGADGTNTSVLDKVCEDIIIRRINEYDLPYNIVSEEIGFVDRGYNLNLVIDPLDGTFNAENEIPLYSMSV
ncbi:bifunctional inositol-1 monophosphatase/fructose-1,6-bisphosphatase, partial [mine drainage metagenome]